MASFSFLTIRDPAQGALRERGSKFLSFAFPVEKEEDVKDHLKSLKKEYFDATHHCYAYRLGPAAGIFKAFDDGEPAHSAGDPILGQIRSRNLTNILVVVVRYFGGTKLGVAGLTLAYKSAAGDALNKSSVVEKKLTQQAHMSYEYAATRDVQRLIRDFNITVLSQHFEGDCNMDIELGLEVFPFFSEKVKTLNAQGIKITLT